MCDVNDGDSPGDNISQTTIKSSKADSTTAKTDAGRTGTPWPSPRREHIIIVPIYLLMVAAQKYGYVLVWRIPQSDY